jgi:hypothetical protein
MLLVIFVGGMMMWKKNIIPNYEQRMRKKDLK